jgi:hypothetical protein
LEFEEVRHMVWCISRTPNKEYRMNKNCPPLPRSGSERIKQVSFTQLQQLDLRKRQAAKALLHFEHRVTLLDQTDCQAALYLLYDAILRTTLREHVGVETLIAKDWLRQGGLPEMVTESLRNRLTAVTAPFLD